MALSSAFFRAITEPSCQYESQGSLALLRGGTFWWWEQNSMCSNQIEKFVGHLFTLTTQFVGGTNHQVGEPARGIPYRITSKVGEHLHITETLEL
jgi:hypothetical protein